ncbi:hypothetical protein ILYODFUR_030808 [Ilyodon furcidens]|uniref:Uncharacterized protein n=1 Tax=Ilyodon furcidens TaxID=33524 RepID=A0ABV0SQJ7_9TELE
MNMPPGHLPLVWEETTRLTQNLLEFAILYILFDLGTNQDSPEEPECVPSQRDNLFPFWTCYLHDLCSLKHNTVDYASQVYLVYLENLLSPIVIYVKDTV